MPSNITKCTPSSQSDVSFTRLHSSSVVPEASTSKKRVPTIPSGPVVLTCPQHALCEQHIFTLGKPSAGRLCSPKSWCARSASRS